MELLNKMSQVVNDHVGDWTYLYSVKFHTVQANKVLGTTDSGINVEMAHIYINGDKYVNIRSTNEVQTRSQTIHHPTLVALLDELAT